MGVDLVSLEKLNSCCNCCCCCCAVVIGQNSKTIDYLKFGEVVEAQLVERSLPTLEVRGSNPLIGKFVCRTFVYYQMYYVEMTKMCHFKKSLVWDFGLVVLRF